MIQRGPKVLIRTLALLQMAWYIAIQHHHNPLSQHDIASYVYVTKFESHSFRLHSKFGVAFAQQESCWRSQQSASKSKLGQGAAKLWQFLLSW